MCVCLLCEQELSLDPRVDAEGKTRVGSLASSQSSQIGKIQEGLMRDIVSNWRKEDPDIDLWPLNMHHG